MKDFIDWHKIKSGLEQKEQRLNFQIREVFFGVPLTHTDKKGKYYFSFKLSAGVSVAILSQIRLFDAKRMKYKIGMISEKDFSILKEKIRQLLV